MRRASLWGLCLLAVSVVAPAYAQSTNAGDIRGTVTDQSGALVPDVTVTVLNVETGVAKDYVTNHDGVFETSSIVTGQYQITFTKTGFNRLVRGPITVQVGLTGVNAQLRIGSTSQQIVVTENVPLLQTENGGAIHHIGSEIDGAVAERWERLAKLYHPASRDLRYSFRTSDRQPCFKSGAVCIRERQSSLQCDAGRWVHDHLAVQQQLRCIDI